MTIESPSARRPLTATLLAVVVVTVVASVANALIAAVGLAMGLASATTIGLQPMAYISLTLMAAVAGAVGWRIIDRSACRPSRVMRWLVPTVLAVSFVPDLIIGASAGTTSGWGYAVVLMAMHVATIVIAIVSFQRLLPLHDRARAISPAAAVR
jgi:hypothetical protein